MGEADRKDPVAQEAESLVEAVRAVARRTINAPSPAKPDAPRLFSRLTLTLLVLALLLTAVALILGDIFPERAVSFFAKILPAVVGTALVAYTEAVRRWLIRVANWPPTLWIGLTALLLSATLRFAPVTIPVIVDRDASLNIDSQPAHFGRVQSPRYPSARSRYVTFSGVRPHVLTLSTRADAHVPRVGFRLSAMDLLANRFAAAWSAFPDSGALHVPALFATSMEKDSAEADLTIVGVLPPLFRDWIADSVDLHVHRDTSTIWISLGKGREPHMPALPAGRYWVKLTTCPTAVLDTVSASNATLKSCNTPTKRAPR